MATKRKLGVYWGQNLLYFVECENNAPKKIFSAPIEQPAVPTLRESTAGLKITATIQKALQEQFISDSAISLAVPPKDIIFRSFVIPQMQPGEIENVVQFEATKYVPFRLEELSYTFFPLPIVENKRKAVRILLIAVRKSILENYCSIFEHSGMRVELIEPATMSLVRVLLLKKLIPKNKTTAIIEFANGEGRITIVDQDVPQFVREFQFYPTPDTPAANTDILRARLFNEVKISFDYFTRQYTQKKVEKILALSRTDTLEILKTLGNDFNIPASTIDLHSLLNAPTGHEIGFISAYGICLRNTVAPKANFDLTWKSLKEKEAPVVQEAQPNYAITAIAALVSAAVIGLSAFASGATLNQNQQKLAQLKQQLGSYESADLNKLSQEIQDLQGQTNNFKQIRMQSQVSLFLRLLPDLLPKGTWLSDLDISYPQGGNINMSFTAHAYAKETNRQFELANNLLKNLKNNKDFSNTFAKIELGSIETDRIQDYSISRFRVTCR